MKYFTVTQYETHGIGSIVQFHYICNALANEMGGKFVFNTLKNVGGLKVHNQTNNTNISIEEWDKSLNDFFNFVKLEKTLPIKHVNNLNEIEGEEIVFNISFKCLLEYYAKNVEKIHEREFIYSIKDNFVYNERSYFDDSLKNICWHIRVPLIEDQPNNVVKPKRRLGIAKQEEDIKAIKNELQKRFGNDICLNIISNGKEDDFNKITNEFSWAKKINLKLNDHVINDLYHMSFCDGLIMANSSYSWCCHLINKNLTLANRLFYCTLHKPLVYVS